LGRALADGGEEKSCSWLKDRYGFSWQNTPELLLHHLASQDPVKVQRVLGTFMTMRKLDIAAIEAALSA